ncbi:MAG: hypothetical protein SVY10_18240 [Thermodesulfobacteriota bacterium]|nr:hypothetical protein [Thermodesulfobacteriota bacterium]
MQRLFLELPLLSKIIVLTIGAFFFIGVLKILREWWYLRKEFRALRRVKANYRTYREKGGIWNENVPKILAEGVQSETALIIRRIGILHEIREKGGEYSRDVLTAIAQSALRGKSAFISYISRALILVVITGIVLGLTQALIGLSTDKPITEKAPAVEKGTTSNEVSSFKLETKILYNRVNRLFDSMDQNLLGMKAAFFTGLLGVGLIVFLTLLYQPLEKWRLDFLSELDDFNTLELAPLFQPSRNDVSLHSSLDSLRIHQQLLTEITSELDDKTRQFGSNLDVFSALIRGLDSSQQGFIEGLEKVGKNQDTINKAQQSLRQSILQFIESIERLNQQEENFNKILNVLTSICEDNDILVKALDENLAFQRKIGASLSQFIKQSEDLFDRRLTGLLSQSNQKLAQSLADQKEASKVSGEIMLKNAELQRTSNSILRQILDLQSRNSDPQKQEIIRLLEKQQTSLSLLQESISKEAEFRKNGLFLVNENISQIFKKFQDSFNTITQQMEVLHKRDDSTSGFGRDFTGKGWMVSSGLTRSHNGTEKYQDTEETDSESMNISPDVLDMFYSVLKEERELSEKRLDLLLSPNRKLLEQNIDQQQRLTALFQSLLDANIESRNIGLINRFKRFRSKHGRRYG